MSEDLNEVDFGRAEGLPQLLAAACLAPTYVAWSKGQDVERAGGGENLAEIQQRAVTAAATLLRACDEGGQVTGRTLQRAAMGHDQRALLGGNEEIWKSRNMGWNVPSCDSHFFVVHLLPKFFKFVDKQCSNVKILITPS